MLNSSFSPPPPPISNSNDDETNRTPFLPPLHPTLQFEINDKSLSEQQQQKTDALTLLLAFGPAFARSPRFLKNTLYAIVIGSSMGVISLLFYAGFTSIFDFVVGDVYKSDLDNGVNMNFNQGSWSFLPYTTLLGFVIGCLRLFPILPSKVDGLFAEVKDLTVHPNPSPLILLISLLSLGLGGSLGPEAALGNAGGALGTFFGNLRSMSDRRKAISTYLGIVGAMGSILPSPVLAVMLVHELGVCSRPGDFRFNAVVRDTRSNQSHARARTSSSSNKAIKPSQKTHHDFMEQVTLGGISATASYILFTHLSLKIDPTHTWLASPGIRISAYTVNEYEVWHNFAGVVLGVVSGVVGIVALLLIGIMRKVSGRITVRLTSLGLHRSVVCVLLPTLAGLIVGVIGKAYPLTLGDGSVQLKTIVQHSFNGTLSHINPLSPDSRIVKEVTSIITTSTLLGTMLMKMVSMSICLSFGLIGGQIFPCIFTGTCLGMYATHVTNWPITLTVPCCMAGVPSSFAPIPFTLVGITCMTLVMNGEMSSPVFVAVFTSFLVNCGMGVTQGFLERENRLGGVMTVVDNDDGHLFGNFNLGGGGGVESDSDDDDYDDDDDGGDSDGTDEIVFNGKDGGGSFGYTIMENSGASVKDLSALLFKGT